MTNPGRLDAIVEADRMLQELDIPRDQPIDVFSAIDRLQLELAIVPLDNLLGAVLPQGNGGVLVTSQRSAAVQRYTAAHEIGHWTLHQDYLVTDTESDIIGSPSSERERQAQLFAAYFLMPPPLVDRAVMAYDLHKGTVSPEQIYLVSRDLGVSFEAATRRLQSHRILSATDVQRISLTGRLGAMKTAFDGRRPQDGRASLWNADPFVGDQRLDVDEQDEVIITLPENRSTGWRWLDEVELVNRQQKYVRSKPTPPDMNAKRQSEEEGVISLGKPGESMLPAQRRPVDVRAALDVLQQHQSTQKGLPAQKASDSHENDVANVVVDEFDSDGTRRSSTAQAGYRRSMMATADLSDLEIFTNESMRIGAVGRRTIVIRCKNYGSLEYKLHFAHAFDPTIRPVMDYTLSVLVRPSPTHAYQLKRLSADLERRHDEDPSDDEQFEVVIR